MDLEKGSKLSLSLFLMLDQLEQDMLTSTYQGIIYYKWSILYTWVFIYVMIYFSNNILAYIYLGYFPDV